jgi:hypothetical protein
MAMTKAVREEIKIDKGSAGPVIKDCPLDPLRYPRSLRIMLVRRGSPYTAAYRSTRVTVLQCSHMPLPPHPLRWSNRHH